MCLGLSESEASLLASRDRREGGALIYLGAGVPAMSINSDDCPWPRTLAHDGLDWPGTEQRVLVPFREAVNLHETSLLGASVAFGIDGELYLLHAVDDGANADPDAIRQDAEVKMAVREEFPVPVVQTEAEFEPDLLDAMIDRHSITTTVVDRAEESFFARGRDDPAPDCHSVVGTHMDRFDAPTSILVPVAKGPHSGLATRVAEAIATAYDSWLELFHVVPEDASDDVESDAEKLLDAYDYRLDDAVEVDHHVTYAPEAADAIIEHASYHDLTVLGAPQKGKLRRFLFGSTTDAVTEHADSDPVLTAHRNTDESTLSRWL
jgi:nucleotide-binding universal stress UspA family protein